MGRPDWIVRKLAEEDVRAETYRNHVGRFFTPSSDELIEKVAEVQGVPSEVQAGDSRKAITPLATVARAGDDLIIISGNGSRLTKGQAERLLNPVQKGKLTRALNQDLKARRQKLNP